MTQVTTMRRMWEMTYVSEKARVIAKTRVGNDTCDQNHTAAGKDMCAGNVRHMSEIHMHDPHLCICMPQITHEPKFTYMPEITHAPNHMHDLHLCTCVPKITCGTHTLYLCKEISSFCDIKLDMKLTLAIKNAAILSGLV